MSNSKKTSNKKPKVWTILCLLFIIVIAVLLRSVVVYKFFPLSHEELINKYSEEYNVDKHLVCSVIKAESSFDETALSAPGAMGLMQIMPDTGSWAAEKIGIEDFKTSMLYEPDTNIRIGCWYLNHLSAMFGGDSKKVLAAYNAGPSRVKEWTDADGVLREIRFEETGNYIEKIERNYEIYKSLYKDF